ncbi:uncharacterized protein [Euphorbia lathyris]|uniref:uncharacterized protein isoform X3 n=1 Tax=Euphorbia lathyris TaxID=212925 RepID=UPI003313440C
MRVYEDEYEDYDEYEEEQEEEGEEEEYEQEQMPTAESQEYLELRKRIKEQIRKKLKKESGSGVSKSQETKKKSSDNYGSFFGPSQPVIAQRVIQESKSLLENPHLIFKTPTPHSLKSKVQKIKDTRDYSFLLSDDAELPAAIKPPVSQNASVSRSEAGTPQMPQKSKQPSGNSARDIRNGREEGKPIPTNGHMHSKSGSYKSSSTSRHSSTSVDSRGQLQNTSATGHGRPVSSMDGRRQAPSKNATGPGRPVESMDIRRHSQSNNGSGPGRPVVSMDRRRQLESNRNGPVRPFGGPKRGPSQAPLITGEKKTYAPGRKDILPPDRKPLPSKMQPSISKQEVERRLLLQERKNLSMQKHSVASSKSQISKPVKQLPSRPQMQDPRLKRKSSRPFDDEDEDMKALSMIRQMCRVNRYRNQVDDDEDLSDMEANFEDIMREEKRSAKIARKEDEEQLRLIEEEERQERMRKLAKKRKLTNH